MMMQNNKSAITAIAMILALLAWAPWMDAQDTHDRVFQERASIDGTQNKETGEIICDYNVNWFPFGRYVASCEGDCFVAFWGQIIY